MKLAVSLAVAAACVLSAQTALAGNTKNGPELYQWLCADCHGPQALGDIGPDIRGESAKEILNSMENGDEMQGLPVGPDEADLLEAYLATLAAPKAN